MNIDNVSPQIPCSVIDEQGFRDMVALCAYFKYADRGFSNDYAMQDWLEAEKEVTIRSLYWIQNDD